MLRSFHCPKQFAFSHQNMIVVIVPFLVVVILVLLGLLVVGLFAYGIGLVLVSLLFLTVLSVAAYFLSVLVLRLLRVRKSLVPPLAVAGTVAILLWFLCFFTADSNPRWHGDLPSDPVKRNWYDNFR